MDQNLPPSGTRAYKSLAFGPIFPAHSRLGNCGEQAVLGKKFDHKTIKKPRLLHLTSMAGSRQNLQLAIRYARLEREGALMGAVLASGQDYSRTGDALMMAVRIGLLESFELVEDRLHIGELVALSEKVRKEIRQRRRTKHRAQILEHVCPAIVYAVGRIGIDPPLSKFLSGVVTGARQHECGRLVRALVVHVGNDRRSDRTADQDRGRARQRVVYRFPTGLGHVGDGQVGTGFGRAAISRDVDGNAAVPS